MAVKGDVQHATHMQGRRDRCTDENGAGNMIKACRDAGDVKVRTGTHVQWLILGLFSGCHHKTHARKHTRKSVEAWRCDKDVEQPAAAALLLCRLRHFA